MLVFRHGELTTHTTPVPYGSWLPGSDSSHLVEVSSFQVSLVFELAIISMVTAFYIWSQIIASKDLIFWSMNQLSRPCFSCLGTGWSGCHRPPFAHCELFLTKKIQVSCAMARCWPSLSFIALPDISTWIHWHSPLCNHGLWFSCCNGYLWVKI